MQARSSEHYSQITYSVNHDFRVLTMRAALVPAEGLALPAFADMVNSRRRASHEANENKHHLNTRKPQRPQNSPNKAIPNFNEIEAPFSPQLKWPHSAYSSPATSLETLMRFSNAGMKICSVVWYFCTLRSRPLLNCQCLLVVAPTIHVNC